VPDLAGPKVLLGVVWAIGTTAAVLVGPIVLALWFAPTAAVAAAQIARSWKGRPEGRRPRPEVATAAAAVMVLGAPFGIAGLVAGVVLGAGGTAAWMTFAGPRADDGAPAVHPAALVLTWLSAMGPAAAAVGPVLLRDHGVVAALVVVTYALVYDAASWIVGSGTRHHWIGPLAGIACIASVTVGIAGIFPQFKGGSAWQLGALALVVAPLGPPVATLLLGSRARAPAWRRLDSLLVMGPVWAVFAALLIG